MKALRRAGVATAILLVVWPSLAFADNSKRQVEDATIDATIAALSEPGLIPIPAKELNDVAPMLKCMAHGDKQLPDCAKEAVYQAVLGKDAAQAAPLVECVIDGKPVVTCAKDAALAQLPPEVGDLLSCGDDVQTCVTKLATKQLPPEVRGVADCMLSGTNPTQCALAAAGPVLPPEAQAVANCLQNPSTAKQCAETELMSHLPGPAQAVAKCVQAQRFNPDPMACAMSTADPATKDALKAIQKAADPLSGSPILEIFDAIQKEDWARLSALIGVQAYKVAACAVLEVVLAPGPHQQILCDTASIFIQKRVDSFRILVDQAKNLDYGGMLGTLAKAGLIDQQCAFAEAISEDVYEVVCGNLAKIIDKGAKDPIVIGTIGAILTANPVIGVAIGVVWDKIVNNKDDDCGTPAEYFANHYLQCQHYGVYLGLNDPQQQAAFSQQLEGACIHEFKRCLDDDKAADVCGGLTTEFNRELGTIAGAYTDMAKQQAQSFKTKFEADRSNICGEKDADISFSTAGMNFMGSCQSMLNNFQPLRNVPNANCTDPNYKAPMVFDAPSAQKSACEIIEKTDLKQVVNDVCAGAGVCFPIHVCNPEKEDCAPVVK
jgi:hypothetical protein